MALYTHFMRIMCGRIKEIVMPKRRVNAAPTAVQAAIGLGLKSKKIKKSNEKDENKFAIATAKKKILARKRRMKEALKDK